MSCQNSTNHSNNICSQNGVIPVFLPVKSELYDILAGCLPEGTSQDVILLYIDVMSLDERRFNYYAEELTIGDVGDLANRLIEEEKESERLRKQAAWNDLTARSFKGIDMQFISPKWRDIALSPRREETFEEISGYLSLNHGITVFNLENNTDLEQAKEKLYWLANLLDKHPILKGMVGAGALKKVIFRGVGIHCDFHENVQYHTGDKSIFVNGMGIYNPDAWVHELGHSIPVDTGLFGNGNIASLYSSNYDEDCAEWFTAMAGENDLDRLRQWNPEKYQYMLDHVSGLEKFLSNQ